MDCTRTLALFRVHSLTSFENPILFLKYCSGQKLWHVHLLEAGQYLSIESQIGLGDRDLYPCKHIVQKHLRRVK